MVTSIYAPVLGKKTGECSAETWNNIFEHVCYGISPFNDDGTLNLQDYQHNTTTYSYKRYKQNVNNKKGKVLKRMEMWKQLDAMMCNASDRKAIQISMKMSLMLAEL